ncbi:uncharacterized protein LOC128211870 [Mya arenaria]|uniref:uncharacterized protein LOC128211870 n=1 Tax=Mya arenaria TaxID=6604 RepID=UPI0022E6FAA9|nr:uncharacterized protein LOC128211870 [Mya arenaria]
MALNDVLILHGPDIAGLEHFYKRELAKNYKAVCPSKMYALSREVGIRDVSLEIVRQLKKNQKVAIIDLNEHRKTRTSLIRLISRKVKDVSISLITIIPKYGCQQVLWGREMAIAEQSLCPGREVLMSSDGDIHRWFSDMNDASISYKHGKVEAPEESEGCQVIKKVVGIYTSSAYKFEVPGLLIQWEFIERVANDKTGIRLWELVLGTWQQENPCGRVIIVSDGSQVHTGETSRTQFLAKIDETMKSISEKLKHGPVYVCVIMDRKKAGCYTTPPSPGILAFLQRRHSLNLHTRRTVYLYETSQHMKMAENAGVRCLKASKVAENPSLVISAHATTTPRIPEMLKDLKIVPTSPNDPPEIPLYSRLEEFCDGKVGQALDLGRCEYLYAAEKQVVERYQKEYAQSATKLGEAGSKISPCKSAIDTLGNKSSETCEPSNRLLNESKSFLTSRDLPSWMKPKKIKSEDELPSSANTEQHKLRTSKYVMTEKELTDMAVEILTQAGKGNLAKQLQEKVKQDKKSAKTVKSETSESDNITAHKNTKHDEQSDSLEDEVESSCHSDSPIDDDGEDQESDSELQCGRFDSTNHLHSSIPLLEQHSDISDLNVNVKSVKHVLEKSPIKTKTGKIQDSPSKGCRRNTFLLQEENFSNILDDLTTKTSVQRPSPSKKKRLDGPVVEGSPSNPMKQASLVSGLLGEGSRGSRTRLKATRLKRTPDLTHLDDIFS